MADRVILEAATTLAWSHWTALGVSGVIAPPETAIDPEALILLTALVADHEPRLRDEALDWCARFGKQFIAAGRMRTLSRVLDAESAARFHVFAATANAAGGTLWPSGAAVPRKFTPSRKSRLARLDTPQRALLRLRCMFGMTARAEILLTMLTQWHPDHHVTAAPLTELGYGKTAIATTLDELTLAGITQRMSIGNANAYQLRRPAELRNLLEPLPLRYEHWPMRLVMLIAAVRLEEQVANKPPIVQSVEAREFAESNRQAFARMRLEPPSIEQAQRYWRDLQSWLATSLAS